MEFNNVTSIQQMLEQMPTDDLRKMLDQELHTEPVNDDSVRLLLSILRDRQKQVTVEMTPNLERAWEKYQRDTDEIWRESRRFRKVRSWITRVAAAAAVLVMLLVPIVPQKAGAESLWDALVRWTTGIVEFFGPHDNNHRIVNYEFKTNNPGLQQIYDDVVDLGVTEPVVPMWLPEGYELVEYEIVQQPASTRVHSEFQNGSNHIIFCVDIYVSDASRMYQKDENDAEYYEHSGVVHQILQNYEKDIVVWSLSNVECLLVIDCQEDNLEEILKSIYIRRKSE